MIGFEQIKKRLIDAGVDDAFNFGWSSHDGWFSFTTMYSIAQLNDRLKSQNLEIVDHVFSTEEIPGAIIVWVNDIVM